MNQRIDMSKDGAPAEAFASAQARPTTLSALPKVRVTSKSAALVVELDTPTVSSSRNGYHAGNAPMSTLRVEVAKALAGQARRMDWSSKISLQLTPAELPAFVAVVMGWNSEARFANHGEGRNKSLVVRNQEDGLYFDMREGERGAAVPVDGAERFALAMLCTQCLGLAYPGVGGQSALTVLRMLQRAGN